MKQIIKGKLYNTDTAREVGCYANAGSWRDFSHIEETLYCKRTGEYFLHGKGGPMTRYAERVDSNSWSGGSRIMPMTYAEACKWAQENLDADEYQAEFGQVSEDDDDVRITFQFPSGIAARLDRAASMRGISKTALLIELVQSMGNDITQ